MICVYFKEDTHQKNSISDDQVGVSDIIDDDYNDDDSEIGII